MPEHAEDFAIAWVQNILNDPSYIRVPLENRLPPAKFALMGANRCFAQGLNTPTTIRNYQPLYRPASATNPKEILVLVSTGSGLDSWDGILSGGILCLLVDNVCAIMASTEFAGRAAVTVELKTSFRRKMRTPGVVVCRAKKMRRDGDGQGGLEPGAKGSKESKGKLWVRGTVEDGMGGIYVEAEALFWDPGLKRKQLLDKKPELSSGIRRQKDTEQDVKLKAKL